MKLPSFVKDMVQEHENEYTLQLTKGKLKGVVVLFGAIVLTSIGLGVWGASREAELVQLRRETQLQKEQLKLLNKKMEVLDKKLESLDSLDREIRQMIKGVESGTLVNGDAKKEEATPKESKEDPSPKSPKKNVTETKPKETVSDDVAVTDVTGMSARLSQMDRKAQRRLSSLFMLRTVLHDGVGKDINDLQALMLTAGNSNGVNSSIPSIWPTRGEITSLFGGREDPVFGGGAYHEGLDIANDTGTNVMAAAKGVVTVAAYTGGYGNLVEIDHGNGFVTRYGHNSVLLVTPGTVVNQGQSIALMGSTGKSTGSHLHYEVRIDGVPTDPILFLPIE